MTDLQSYLLAAIAHHDASRPRNSQRALGPSDVGNPCDHCLAARLAGWEMERDLAWLPYIGTAVHAQLAEALSGNADVMTEVRTIVGTIGGQEVSGTADLFHVPTSTVVDYKVVGASTLTRARRGDVSAQYKAQVHLYAKGLGAERAAIMFLPRNAPIEQAVWWVEDYDPLVASRALLRAEGIALELRALGDGIIPGMARHVGCYDCARYPDWAEFASRQYSPKPARSVLGSIMER